MLRDVVAEAGPDARQRQLVERRTDDPALSRLAHDQERELRRYLFATGDDRVVGTGALGDALREAAARFEVAYDARVEVLVPDDLQMIEVTGADRVAYLDDVTTQKLDDAKPGEVRGAMVLDVHGAPLATFWVVVHAERLALLAPPAAAEHVLEVLANRTFLSDAVFTATEAAVWALRGDGIDAALAEVGVTGLAPGNWRLVGDGLVVRHAFGAQVVGDDLADGGQHLVGAPGDVAGALDQVLEVGAVGEEGRKILARAGHEGRRAGLAAAQAHLRDAGQALVLEPGPSVGADRGAAVDLLLAERQARPPGQAAQQQHGEQERTDDQQHRQGRADAHGIFFGRCEVRIARMSSSSMSGVTWVPSAAGASRRS
ncbi:MAG: hypothetical protein KY442_13090 [Proteobacteria bacterium]|nr:hypothetical protein [Pseudomonadota bacterium]